MAGRQAFTVFMELLGLVLRLRFVLDKVDLHLLIE